MKARNYTKLAMIMAIALLLCATKLFAADFGQANTYDEFYFSFSNENEGSAVLLASPKLDDVNLQVTKVSDALYVVQAISNDLVIAPPTGSGTITVPGQPSVTIPKAQTIFLVNDGKAPVVRILVDSIADLRVEQVNLRVTLPRPPVRPPMVIIPRPPKVN